MMFPSALVQIAKDTIIKTMTMKTRTCRTVALLGALAFTIATARAADPLPSWNDTAPKQAIVAFVEKVTREGSPDFVPVPERTTRAGGRPAMLYRAGPAEQLHPAILRTTQ